MRDALYPDGFTASLCSLGSSEIVCFRYLLNKHRRAEDQMGVTQSFARIFPSPPHFVPLLWCMAGGDLPHPHRQCYPAAQVGCLRCAQQQHVVVWL